MINYKAHNNFIGAQTLCGGQGTIEYLLIVAVVVVISLVVVGLVVSQTESVSSVSSTTSSIAQKSGVVGAGDVVVDVDREGIIVLENNSGENISVTGLSFGGIDNNYSVSVVAGDKKSFSVLSVGDACSCVGYEGQKRPCEVIVKTVSQYGLEKNYSMNINVDCVNNATPTDLNKLVSPTSYGATAALGEYCLSNYKCLSGFCDSYLNNVCTDGSVDSNCADGTECAEPNVCTSHLCVDGNIGANCSSGSDCYLGYCDTYGYYQCTDGSLGQYCGDNSGCASGLYCGDDSYGCSIDCELKCRTGAVGSPCTAGNQCALGYCDNYSYYTCTDGSNGQYCSDNSGCASGYCGDDVYCVSSCGRECTSGGVGAYCSANSHCASPNVCDTADTYTCVDGSLGASCTSSAGCSSGFCYGSICTTGELGIGCDSGNDCDSGFCNTDSNVCSTGVPGSGCGANADCDTYNCVTNVCSADLPAITSELVGYWPFDETSGTIAIDYSGSDKNGTLLNGVLVNQTGKVGKAYRFDGTDDIVKIVNFESYLVDKTALTYSMWVNLDTYANRGVITNTLDNYAQTEFTINSTSMTFCIYTNGDPNGWCPSTISQALGLNSWHMLTFVYNGAQTNIYIDGNSVQTFSVSGSTARQNSTAKDLIIGGRSINTYVTRWDGFIDEVAIWNRPLASEEILNLYNSGNGLSLIS